MVGDERLEVGSEDVVCTADDERGRTERLEVPRHAQQKVAVAVRGKEIDVSGVTDSSAPVVLGQDLRDLGAAVAVRVVERLGGAVSVSDSTLTIRLP